MLGMVSPALIPCTMGSTPSWITSYMGTQQRWSACIHADRVVIAAVDGELERLRRHISEQQPRVGLLGYGWATPVGPRLTWSLMTAGGDVEPVIDPHVDTTTWLNRDRGGWIRGIGTHELLMAAKAKLGIVVVPCIGSTAPPVAIDPAWDEDPERVVAMLESMGHGLEDDDGYPVGPQEPDDVKAEANRIATWRIVLQGIPDRGAGGAQAWPDVWVWWSGLRLHLHEVHAAWQAWRISHDHTLDDERGVSLLAATHALGVVCGIKRLLHGSPADRQWVIEKLPCLATDGDLHRLIHWSLHTTCLLPSVTMDGTRSVRFLPDRVAYHHVRGKTWWPGWSIGHAFNHAWRGDEITMPIGSAPTMRLVDDAVAATAQAEALCAESLHAMSNGTGGTIPPDAVVSVHMAGIRSIRLHDRGWCVDAVITLCGGASDGQQIGLSVELEPPDGTSAAVCSINAPLDAWGDAGDRVEATLFVLVSAIIRDFRVVEERERAFRRVLRHGRGAARRDGPRVVYLPRRRYTGSQPDTDHHDLTRHVGLTAFLERRTSDVRAHVRRCDHPSAEQVLIAERHGFRLDPGFTFVRPHRRGGIGERPVVYKSRSATGFLLADWGATVSLDEPDDLGIPDWFRFERLVADLLEHDGWSITRRAATLADAHGDGGVDIRCIRTRGTTLERLIVSCKCWRQDRPIGVEHVRELIGVRTLEDPGTMAMLVVRPGCTAEAMRIAAQSGITIRVI